MNLHEHKFFTDEEMQHLILAYMYSRKDEAVPTADCAAFLSACKGAIVVAESVRMVADGLLLVTWDKTSGAFGFALSNQGEAEAERLEVNG